ncbi:MAG: SIR2 family protein [Clostridiales bacterium]|nr:SIR2 family protein [Clostridiales bacterium]
MDMREKIIKIREAMNNNRLVIFVGSGVSANSNLPTWDSLIKTLAEQIGYDKCDACSLKSNNCPTVDCSLRYKFSSDEFLKIPQYAYNQNAQEYYKLINDIINISAESNIIHDLIVDMKPNHIITTNYDKLLETSNSISSSQYVCICNDKDLLTKKGEHYIIKMHGDIDAVEDIVLREDDYLHYENKHILIQTFIKALLVDHTFLFVGYSLGDYNLKLILSWIDFLSEKEKVAAERTDNFLLSYKDGAIEEYEKRYWENKKIQVINAYELPSQVLEAHSRSELNETGSAIYSCLKYIEDEENDYLVGSLAEVLIDKYAIFDGYNYIAYSDISNVYYWAASHYDRQLHFYRKEDFEKFNSIANNEIVADYLKKAGIYSAYALGEIENFGDKEVHLVEFESDDDDLESTLCGLYLKNSYEQIIDLLNECDDKILKAYYNHVIRPDSEATEQSMNEINKNDNLVQDAILLYNKSLYPRKRSRADKRHKLREDTLRYIDMVPLKNKKAFEYIKEIINNGIHRKDLIKTQEQLTKHEALYRNPYSSSSNPHGQLYEIQVVAYQYYLFFKSNYIYLDHYSYPKTMFWPYVQSMLITYCYRKEVSETYAFFEKLESYKFNAIDLDMLVKFSDYDRLNKYIMDNNIKGFIFDSNLNINENFKELCASLVYCSENGKLHQVEKFKNFSLIIRFTNTDFIDKNQIIEALLILATCSAFKKMMEHLSFNMFDEYYSLLRLVYDNKNEHCAMIATKIIDSLDWKEVNAQNQHSLSRLFKHFEPNDSDDEDILQKTILCNLEKYETSVPIARIGITTWPIANAKTKNIIKDWISSNLDILGYGIVFRCLIQGIISYTPECLQPFVNTIDETIKQNTGAMRILPDYLTDAIDKCIILYLAGYFPSIEFLRTYVQYSEYLQFIFDSDGFDYSKVNINHHMWVNIMLNQKFRDILLDNCKNKLKEDISQLIENGTASKNLSKIYYRFICPED